MAEEKWKLKMINNICRFCGEQGEGKPFGQWVKPTFTDHDKLQPGEIICNNCLFWFNEASTELAQIIGKEKPQRMRNYSHFVVGGNWVPLSKGDKARMAQLLLGNPFPELAAIAESGQKHIVFRARRNPNGSRAGWIQFEENQLWVDPDNLRFWLDLAESMLITFSKTEIISGNYLPYRILDFGLKQWQANEAKIKPQRGSLFFNLVLFLAQRKEKTDERKSGNGGQPTRHHLAGDQQRLQEPIPPDDLGAIREHGQGKRLHQQPGEIRQLSLFETGGDDSGQAHG